MLQSQETIRHTLSAHSRIPDEYLARFKQVTIVGTNPVPGIFFFHNEETNQIYIGSTSDLRHIELHYFDLLKHNKHHALRLQEAFNANKAFKFKIVAMDSLLYARELSRTMKAILKGSAGLLNGNTEPEVTKGIQEYDKLVDHAVSHSKPYKRINPRNVPVSINGVRFDNAEEAARVTGLSSTTIRYRIGSVSARFANYVRLKKGA